MQALHIAMLILFSYVLGSVPSGYWIAKLVKGIDIRQFGSGSTGATNVWRCVGKGAGVTVFVIDVLKGVIPVALAMQLTAFTNYLGNDPYQVLPVIMALVALVGHSKSIFLNFEGGKSAATGLGTLFALHTPVGLLTFITWITLLVTVRIVSVASIAAVFASILYMILLKAPNADVIYCILGFAYITFRHKANIKRLLNGTEPRLGDKPRLPPHQP